MAHVAEDYRQIDLATGSEIKAGWLAQGVASYPAICGACHGSGRVFDQKCGNCEGEGSYELAV